MTRAQILKRAMMLGLGAGIAAISATPGIAQAKTTLPIYIPSKLTYNTTPSSSSPYPQIGLAKLYVSMTSRSQVAFTIADSTGPPLAFQPLTTSGIKQTLVFSSGDTVIVQPNAAPGDPYRYEIDFVLRSHSDQTCRSQMETNQATYTLSVGAGNPAITRACLDSYDGLYVRPAGPLSCSNAALGANLIPIPLDNAKDKVASFDPANQPAQNCVSFVAPNPPGNLHGTVHASRSTRVSDGAAR